MKNRICTVLLISMLIMLISADATAQSMQVFGGERSAVDCYLAASIAAEMHSASYEDVEHCTFALEETSMKLKDRVATLVNRGIIYTALEDFNKAIKDYNSAFKISPNIAEIHVNRGNLLYLSKHYTQAIPEYTRAIELNLRKKYIVYYNRGLAYEKLGQQDKAIADYRSALELMPGWSRAQKKLDRLLNPVKRG